MSELTADQIVSELRKMENSAQVVLDGGFGTREGEHDLIYRKRRDIAKGAADLIESIQREQGPEPITDRSSYREYNKKPIWVRMKNGFVWCGVMWFNESMNRFAVSSYHSTVWLPAIGEPEPTFKLFATEPKGEPHD